MQSEAMIRKAAEAIWAIRREEEDRCDMSLDDMGGEESSVWHEAKAALEAALPAAEPVAWQPRYKQEVIDHHRSIGSDLWEYAMTVYPTKEQAQGYGYGGHECRALYAAPPAPSVAVKASKDENLISYVMENMDWSVFGDENDAEVAQHAANSAWSRIRLALSAQVQDVAEPDFSYRIEYDYRSYVEKKTMWGLYRELGVVALEEAQEALRTAQQNNACNFRISRKPVVKWEPLPAAPAKQDGGTNE